MQLPEATWQVFAIQLKPASQVPQEPPHPSPPQRKVLRQKPVAVLHTKPLSHCASFWQIPPSAKHCGVQVAHIPWVQ